MELALKDIRRHLGKFLAPIVGVRLDDGAAFEQFAQRGGHGDLPRLAARGVDARIQRLDRALNRFQRQRAGHQAGDEHAGALLQAWLDLFSERYLLAKNQRPVDQDSAAHQRLRALAAAQA